MAGGGGSPVKPLTGNTGGNADLHGMDGVIVNKSLLELAAAGQSVNMLECCRRSDCSSIQPLLKPLLVHGQVTIIFVVSVCLFVCLFVQSFSQPSLIRFRSHLDVCYMSGSSCVP